MNKLLVIWLICLFLILCSCSVENSEENNVIGQQDYPTQQESSNKKSDSLKPTPNVDYEYKILRTIPNINRPFSIEFKDEKMVVAANGHNSVMIFDKDFNLIKEIKGFNGPHSIDFDKDGNIVVSDYLGGNVYKIVDDQLVKILSGINGPASAFFDRDFNLYVPVYRESYFNKYNSEYELIETIGSSEMFYNPHSMVQSPLSGVFYITDTKNHQILKYDGDFSKVDASFNMPIALDFDEDGNYYVINYGNNQVQKFNAEDELLGEIGGFFSKPYEVEAYNGLIYIAEEGGARIIEVEWI